MALDSPFGFVEFMDDFNRNVIGTLDWTINQANSATNFAINAQVNGVIRGTVTSNSRNDYAIVYGPFIHRPDQGGPLKFEARVAVITSLSVSVFVGMTDANTVEISLQYNNASFSSTATDAFGFYWGASGTSWRCGGVANDVDSVQTTSPARMIPVLAAFQTLSGEINGNGAGTFRIDGETVAELIAGCGTATVLLGRQVSIRDDGAAGSIDVDYFHVRAARYNN